MMALSVICTLVHTISVMGLIWLVFGSVYSRVVGVGVGSVIVTVLLSNGLFEMMAAGMMVPFMYRALKPIREKMNI